ELCGVYEGLMLARRMNFTRIEVHVDSAVVVKDITTRGSTSMQGRALVEKIRHMLDLNWKVEVQQHSYCEANQLADALANHGCSLMNGCIYFDDCPHDFRDIMMADS
ncbi:ethylene responsive transcription factor 1b, partial [Trifolium pratense]